MLKREYFYNNSQRHISLTVRDDKQISRESEFGIIAANDHCLGFKNFTSFYTSFRQSGKQNVLRISEITQHFQNSFIDCDRETRALQEICEATECCRTTQSSFFRWKQVLWKNVKDGIKIVDLPQAVFSLIHQHTHTQTHTDTHGHAHTTTKSMQHVHFANK